MSRLNVEANATLEISLRRLQAMPKSHSLLRTRPQISLTSYSTSIFLPHALAFCFCCSCCFYSLILTSLLEPKTPSAIEVPSECHDSRLIISRLPHVGATCENESSIKAALYFAGRIFELQSFGDRRKFCVFSVYQMREQRPAGVRRSTRRGNACFRGKQSKTSYERVRRGELSREAGMMSAFFLGG